MKNDELRNVLARAAEIQYAESPGGAELEKFIADAEKAGYTRAALERALRERFGQVDTPPAVGELAFARSSDGRFYAARVLSQSADTARVEFLGGGTTDVTLDGLRPFSLIPGERVSVAWPGWGDWSCTVMMYDAANAAVRLSDRWGSEALFPISAVWVEKPTAQNQAIGVKAMLLGGGVIAGAMLGAIITALLLR